MEHRAWILGGLTVVGVGLVYYVSSRPPRVLPGSRLFLFGDSMAEGLSPHLHALAREQGTELQVVAVRGSRVRQWEESQKLIAQLESFDPDVVLVALGTNDAVAKTDVSASAAELLCRIAESLPESETAWIGVPALPEDANVATRDELEDVAPHYFPTDSMDLPMGPDGVHPTARGYAAWAGSIWQWLT